MLVPPEIRLVRLDRHAADFGGALGITYFFSRGITAPLRQMRDVAEAMADGDYTVRVDIDQDRHDEVASWLARSTRWPANSSMPIKCAAT